MTTYYFLRQGEWLQRIKLGGFPFGVTEVLNILLPPNCKINASVDFKRDGVPTVFCHDQVNGDLFIYSPNESGVYIKWPTIGAIGPEWELHVCRFSLATDDGIGAYILSRNRGKINDPNFEKIMIWHTTGTSTLRPIADLNPFWQGGDDPVPGRVIDAGWDLQFGDFNRDGILDMFGRRTADHIFSPDSGRTGDLRVWFFKVVNGIPAISWTQNFGNIGLEWRLQVADMNGDGYADLFGSTANNDLFAWYNIENTGPQGRGIEDTIPYGWWGEDVRSKGWGRRLDSGHNYGKLGTEWQHLQVTYLKDYAFPDILGQSTDGRIGGWYTNGRAFISPFPGDLGAGPGWTPLAGFPKTAVV